MTAADNGTQNDRGAAECFLTTRWSRVVLAGEGSGHEAERALESLCGDY